MQRNRMWITLLAATLLLLGCDSSSNPADLTPTELLRRAHDNMKALKSYQSDQVAGITTNRSGDERQTYAGVYSNQIDVVGNRTFAVVTNTFGTEVVTGYNLRIGDDDYISRDRKNFERANYPPEVRKTLEESRNFDLIGTILSGTGTLRDGNPARETVAGQDTRHLIADAGGVMTDTTNGRLEFWITTGDRPLIVKAASDTTKIAGTRNKTTTLNSRFDEPVNIPEPPRLWIVEVDCRLEVHCCVPSSSLLALCCSSPAAAAWLPLKLRPPNCCGKPATTPKPSTAYTTSR